MADIHFIGNVLPDLSVMIVQVEQEVSWSADLKRTKCYNLRLLDVFDRQMLALGDDVLHFAEFLAVERRLSPIHYIIYRAFAEDCDEQPREQARQPTSLSGLRNVAFATVLPLPNLLGDKEAVKEEEDFVLQPFEPLLLGNLVEGKDIDVDALMHLDMLERGFRETRAIYPDFHKVERRMRLRVRSLEEVFVAKFLPSNLCKTLVVRSHHAHIDVIVPGQDLLPEVSANSRSTRHKVTDVMLLADAIHLA